MTIETWTMLGGWYAAAISMYLAGVLLFTKPDYTAHDSEQREQMGRLVIMFGWIPAGMAAIAIEGAWRSLFGP